MAIPDKAFLVEMLRKMILIRRFEQSCFELHSRGEAVGIFSQSNGQEAVAVGACSALRPDDYIVSNHRGRGHALAKGAELGPLMAETFAKVTGYCKGKGNLMHVVDLAHGILPTAAIVGAGIPMATGAALALRKRGSAQVVVCFFGDGACNIGFFHESLNFASIHSLPVVFLAENNQYAISMPQKKSMAVLRISDRACAYGIPGFSVDGNDVLAVFEATSEAVERARSGGGPTLLECVTYRLLGHSHGDQGGGIKYRSQEEMDAWAAKDPIPRFREHLVAQGILTEADAETIESAAATQIEEAIQFAKASPLPSAVELLSHVFAQESTSQ